MERLNINLSKEVSDEIKEMCQKRSCNMTEFVKHAISLEKWFQEILNNGDKLLVKRGRTTYEIMNWPWSSYGKQRS